jgi:hypothetical protein
MIKNSLNDSRPNKGFYFVRKVFILDKHKRQTQAKQRIISKFLL